MIDIVLFQTKKYTYIELTNISEQFLPTPVLRAAGDPLQKFRSIGSRRRPSVVLSVGICVRYLNLPTLAAFYLILVVGLLGSPSGLTVPIFIELKRPILRIHLGQREGERVKSAWLSIN